MEKSTLIKVTNRNGCMVGYPVPDNVAGLERMFAPGETKDIVFEELEKLAWTPGGKVILKEFLVMDNAEAVNLLLGEVEPEYNYTRDDIKKLLVEGSLEELMDCLDFGPEGVIDIIKDIAVETEIPDIRKRQAITDKTGLNINTAIELKHMEEEDDEEQEVAPTKTRRVAVEQKTDAPTRRVTTSKYTTKK